MGPTGKRVFRPVQIILPIVLLASAGVASHYASRFIALHFPGRPRPADLLFQSLPYVSAAQYTSDIAVYSALLILAFYSLRYAREEMPRIVTMISVMYLLRAAMIILTPLASAHGDGSMFGFVPYVQNGMWPSGHTADTFLCFLLINASKAPGLRRLTGAMVVVQCVSLILARGHYSIDVVGGLLLSYFVFHEWMDGRLMNPLKRIVEPTDAV